MPMSLREPPSSWTAMFQGWLEHFLGRSIQPSPPPKWLDTAGGATTASG